MGRHRNRQLACLKAGQPQLFGNPPHIDPPAGDDHTVRAVDHPNRDIGTVTQKGRNGRLAGHHRDHFTGCRRHEAAARGH